MELSFDLSSWGYWGLFISAFLSGTVVPFSSEALLGLLIIKGYSPWGCIIAASAGNWLGGITCYYIGYWGKTEWIHKYLRISQEKVDRWINFLQGKGSLLGFFGFIPIVGDIIIVALGLMKANRWGAIISILIGKFARYYFVVFLLDKVQALIPDFSLSF